MERSREKTNSRVLSVAKKDKTQQIISILICWLAYTVTYFGKYSYNANISLIEEDYAVTHTQTGLVLTLFAAVYGVG